jgi:hypothetical protein
MWQLRVTLNSFVHVIKHGPGRYLVSGRATRTPKVGYSPIVGCTDCASARVHLGVITSEAFYFSISYGGLRALSAVQPGLLPIVVR